MNTMKKLLSAMFIFVLAAVTAFSMDVNKEIGRYTAEQQLLINAYKLMIDGEDDTMDNYTSDENDTLIEHLSMADGDWEILWDDLESTYDLQGNEPEAIYLRYLIANTFKKKLDIETLNTFAKELKAKEFSSVKTYNTMQNVIVSCVKGLNPKNKSNKLESLECVSKLAVQLAGSANITASVSYALQDETVKKYILGIQAESSVDDSEVLPVSNDIQSYIKTNFKKELPIKEINIIASKLKAEGKNNDQIKQIACNFLGDFVKGLNPKSKQNKAAQDTIENIAAIMKYKLADSSDIIKSTALALSDPGVKDYILNN
ncbi:MAG: hypothetical protein IKP67_10400 [Spirochaetales bacterium]|nr:hypothetical protein [Spirochaetales bacterium]